MIFKKKHIVTSKERKKNGIYILYTQHVFPTFSSFSPTARVIRFPLPPSLPLLPLFLFTPKHLKVQKESHHRRRNPPWPQLSEKSTRLRSMQSRGKHHHSILLFSSMRCAYSGKGRERKNAFHRGALMPPLRGGACTSDSNFAGTHSHSRLLIPRDFVDGRGPYS